MSREKQIEEITRVICKSNRDGICGYDRKPCNFDCGNYQLSTELYNAGYRKASDVAEEIFAEVDSLLEGEEKRYDNLSDEADDPRFSNEYWEASLTISSIRTMVTELKKKYTEEEK